jgi:hypothetical protein
LPAALFGIVGGRGVTVWHNQRDHADCNGGDAHSAPDIEGEVVRSHLSSRNSGAEF